MTDYARASSAAAGASFTCQIKSVNSRSLGIRLRLAPSSDVLKSEIPQLIGKMVTRGSITCNLAVEHDGAGGMFWSISRSLPLYWPLWAN